MWGLTEAPTCDLKCRFYKEELPEIGDTVMGEIVRTDEAAGAYVVLKEYNQVQGLLLLTELTRKRVRSMNKLVKIGKTEPLLVTGVDQNQGFIDLSRKSVKTEERQECEERYSKAR